MDHGTLLRLLDAWRLTLRQVAQLEPTSPAYAAAARHADAARARYLRAFENVTRREGVDEATWSAYERV